jgi:hypothetical protein
MNIISYSLWGKQPLYVFGALENVKLAKVYLPDWKCRFYCSDDVPGSIIRELEKLGADIDFAGRSAEYSGLFWRYRPMFDDYECDRFIVRDTDSRITPRDAWCVNQWIESDAPAHVIRDCESHGAPILGGTCGFKPAFFDNFESMVDAFLSRFQCGTSGYGTDGKGALYGTDQRFLADYIWPLIQDTVLAHDNFFHYTGREVKIPLAFEQGGRWIGQHADKEPYIGQVCDAVKEYNNFILE